MPRRTSSYKAARGFSLYFDTKDNLPEFYKEYPQLTVDTIKKTAQDAMDQTWSITPQKTGQLRNNTDVIAYSKGSFLLMSSRRWQSLITFLSSRWVNCCAQACSLPMRIYSGFRGSFSRASHISSTARLVNDASSMLQLSSE